MVHIIEKQNDGFIGQVSSLEVNTKEECIDWYKNGKYKQYFSDKVDRIIYVIDQEEEYKMAFDFAENRKEAYKECFYFGCQLTSLIYMERQGVIMKYRDKIINEIRQDLKALFDTNKLLDSELYNNFVKYISKESNFLPIVDKTVKFNGKRKLKKLIVLFNEVRNDKRYIPNVA